jgi:hypothetical protein
LQRLDSFYPKVSKALKVKSANLELFELPGLLNISFMKAVILDQYLSG